MVKVKFNIYLTEKGDADLVLEHLETVSDKFKLYDYREFDYYNLMEMVSPTRNIYEKVFNCKLEDTYFHRTQPIIPDTLEGHIRLIELDPLRESPLGG